MSQEHPEIKHRRRNFYIDKDFQTRFILKFCGLVAGGAGLTIILLYLLSQQSTSVSFVNARVKVMTTGDFILPLLVSTVLIVMGCVSVGAVAVTLFVSHKIAGPLYRFRQTLKELALGNFTNHIRLRRHDQLIEIGDDFNHMISAVRARVVEIKSMLALMKADMEVIGEFNVEDHKRKRFLDLKYKVQSLEKEMEFFKT